MAIFVNPSRFLRFGALVVFILVLLYLTVGHQGGAPNDRNAGNFFGLEDASNALFGAKGSPMNLSQPSTEFLDLAKVDLPAESYRPYPWQIGAKWWSKDKGPRACKGPRGNRLDTKSDVIQAHRASTEFPNPAPLFGAFDETGIDGAHCFDRNSRLDPYGFEGNENIQWDTVNWGSLQDECTQENKEQYAPEHSRPNFSKLELPSSDKSKSEQEKAGHKRRSDEKKNGGQVYRQRTAVVLRGWDSVKYTPELRESMRSMIHELSLETGGEYAVYLLVEIKNPSLPIWESEAAYNEALNSCVPPEFRSLTLLFNQALLEKWYPDTNPSNGGQALHMNQPLQLFSLFNPQFDHMWGIELDVRYIGNWYNYLASMASWSQEQPRKLQWELASNFYMPSFHGTYTNYTSKISALYPNGGIWGPLKNPGIPKPIGPNPPKASPMEDDFEWGVGEDADDITPSAVIDTAGTGLFRLNPVAGFEAETERHALMVTPVKRLSRRLLKVMHEAQLGGFDMRSELFAHTIALAHGLKVVHVPIPMYYNDSTATPGEVDVIFNDGPNDRRAKIWADGGAEEQLQAMSKTTYWWRLEFEQFPRKLYRRWYGLDDEGKPLSEQEAGRLCIPGLMLHPVKDVVK